MDKNYIQNNGILELYVLGELSAKENSQVEAILETDEALRIECETIENNFETLALENAITPNTRVKEALFNSIKAGKDISKVIPIETKKKTPIFQYVAASIAALFIVSSAVLFNKWQTAEDNLQVLQEETNTLNTRISTIENDLKITQDWYNAINKPEVRQLVLKGNSKSPNSKAIAYVNHTEKKVILNPQKLVKLDDSKTYQMWADVDGVMIDMGIIPKDKSMVAMTYIENAESLNITIEPAGGNDHPTVEQLITNIYL